jgi:hypothetical protein
MARATNCWTSPGKTRCFSGGTTPTRLCCAIERGAWPCPTCTHPPSLGHAGQTLRHRRAVWLVTVFFLLPFLILLYISFVDMGNDIHPFKPIWDSRPACCTSSTRTTGPFSADWDGALFQTLYIEAYLRSVVYALCHGPAVPADRLSVCLLHCTLSPLRCAQRC